MSLIWLLLPTRPVVLIAQVLQFAFTKQDLKFLYQQGLRQMAMDEMTYSDRYMLGIKTIDYFQVYNRWGGLIYSHKVDDGQGWDGTMKGLKQNAGTFIWMVRGTDILGNVHFKKGTLMLLR